MQNKTISLIFVCFFMLVLASCVPTSPIPEPGEEGKGELDTAVPPTATTKEIINTPVLETASPPATPQQIEEIIVTTEPANPNLTDPAIQPLVTQAKEDLASRLDVPIDQIELVEFKLMVWPDSSLGCPQPDMAYLQVQQDGSLIRLSVEGRLYDYHAGGNRAPFLCEKLLRVKPTPHTLDEFITPPGNVDD